MPKNYLHIPVEGPCVLFVIEDGENELHALQHRVGGYITSAGRTVDGHTLYVDDEGLLKGKVVNGRASSLWGAWLVGDAVVVGLTDSEGETGSVTERFLADVEAEFDVVREVT